MTLCLHADVCGLTGKLFLLGESNLIEVFSQRLILIDKCNNFIKLPLQTSFP